MSTKRAAAPKTDPTTGTLTEAPRRLEYRPLDDLQGDPRNPKSHDLALINTSITDFGVIEPVNVDGRTGFLISGHGRTETMRRIRDAGEAPPSGVVIAEDGAWLVPVNVGWSSTNDREARAAVIALNQTTIAGGWMDEALLDALEDLADTPAGLLAVGFGDDDLEALRRKIEADGIFTHGTGDMADEFRTLTGQDETGYTANFAHKVVAYFQTDQDLADFVARNGLERVEKNRIAFPLGWVPTLG